MKKYYLGLIVILLMGSCESNLMKVIKNTSRGSALGTSYSIIYLSAEKLDFQKDIDSVLPL